MDFAVRRGYGTAMQVLRLLMRRLAPLKLQLALLLALLAVGGRVTTPTGWMPVAGVDGVHFVLCSGRTAPAGTPAGHHLPTDQDTGECPFAVAATGADVPLSVAATIPAPQAFATAVAIWRAVELPTSGIGARSRPATGPPITA